MAESGNGNGGSDLRNAILRLAEEADGDMPWRDLARTLKDPVENSSDDAQEERTLEVAKAMRDAGALYPAGAHYSIARAVMDIAERRMMVGPNPALKAVSEKMNAVERMHGLNENQFWKKSDAPEEFLELGREYVRIRDSIITATFEEYGEPELAAMYRYDDDRFYKLYEEGRLQFFGPFPDA